MQLAESDLGEDYLILVLAQQQPRCVLKSFWQLSAEL